MVSILKLIHFLPDYYYDYYWSSSSKTSHIIPHYLFQYFHFPVYFVPLCFFLYLQAIALFPAFFIRLWLVFVSFCSIFTAFVVRLRIPGDRIIRLCLSLLLLFLNGNTIIVLWPNLSKWIPIQDPCFQVTPLNHYLNQKLNLLSFLYSFELW